MREEPARCASDIVSDCMRSRLGSSTDAEGSSMMVTSRFVDCREEEGDRRQVAEVWST